ncbi:MAG: hypothetical protein LBK53_08000 [Heliobacteriaceae bacterium]|nr:hypothetical protein [Heliobacteriaceae bacterium]
MICHVQMLNQRISAGLKAPCEAGRYSGRTPIIQDEFSMTGRSFSGMFLY